MNDPIRERGNFLELQGHGADADMQVMVGHNALEQPKFPVTGRDSIQLPPPLTALDTSGSVTSARRSDVISPASDTSPPSALSSALSAPPPPQFAYPYGYYSHPGFMVPYPPAPYGTPMGHYGPFPPHSNAHMHVGPDQAHHANFPMMWGPVYRVSAYPRYLAPRLI